MQVNKVNWDPFLSGHNALLVLAYGSSGTCDESGSKQPLRANSLVCANDYELAGLLLVAPDRNLECAGHGLTAITCLISRKIVYDL